VSGYLAGLVARAAPLAADPAVAPSVSPEAPAAMRDADDPFEATVYDAPAWPATPRAPAAKSDAAPVPPESRARTPGPPIEARVVDAVAAAIEPAVRAGTDERHDASQGPARSESAEHVVSIAQTLRPADVETPPAQRSRASEDAPAAPSSPSLDPLSIADRFMAQVVPPALLPPEVRIETTREIVRAAVDSHGLPPVDEGSMLEPQAAPEPANNNAEPRGLVIGTLRINVVPPAPQPVAAPRPAASSPRVVVVTSGAAAPSVPSFSRFG